MICDPIVEEIRQTRQRLLEECDGQLDRLMDRFQSREDQDRDRLVTYECLREKRKGERSGPRK